MMTSTLKEATPMPETIDDFTDDAKDVGDRRTYRGRRDPAKTGAQSAIFNSPTSRVCTTPRASSRSSTGVERMFTRPPT